LKKLSQKENDLKKILEKVKKEVEAMNLVKKQIRDDQSLLGKLTP
jgi:hypothetical protein